MTNQFLNQLDKSIPVKLQDYGNFSGIFDIQLKDFSIECFLEINCQYSPIEQGFLEHPPCGGELINHDIEISDLIVYDDNGDDIILSSFDTDKIVELIKNNIEVY